MEPDEIRERSRAAWDQAAAGWSSRRRVFTEAGAPVSAKLVEMAALEPGDCVLEVACGLADTGLLAAGAVAPGGRVLISDSSAVMVAQAAERAQEEAPPGVSVEAARLEAESLGLESATVDAVVSRWGYMLLPDPGAGLQEARRVLRPGGRLAVAVWGPRAANPWIALVQEQLERLGHAAPVDDRAPGMFALSAPGALEELLGVAGFSGPRAVDVAVVWSSPSLDERWQEMIETSVSLPGTLAGLPPRDYRRLREAVDEALAPYVASDGSVSVPGLSIVACAEA